MKVGRLIEFNFGFVGKIMFDLGFNVGYIVEVVIKLSVFMLETEKDFGYKEFGLYFIAKVTFEEVWEMMVMMD